MSSLIYKSPCTVRSLWQEYRIYDDRLELDTHLGQVDVPLANIERVELSPSDVSRALRGDLQLCNFKPALKLDWANFVEHVVVDRTDGRVRRILFTPDNPQAFKAALDGALDKFARREA